MEVLDASRGEPPDPSALSEAFRRDGYLILRGLLDPAVVDRLAARVVEIVGRNAAEGPELQTAHQADGRAKLHKLSNLTFSDPAFRSLAETSGIVDVLELLLGPGVRRFRDVTIVRPSGTEAAISWHQDSAYWDIEPPALVSVWTPLVDVPAGAANLRLIPGSHVRPREHRLRWGERWLPRSISRALRRAVSFAGTGDARGNSGGSTLLWDAKKLVLASATRLAPDLYGLQDFRVPEDEIDLGGMLSVTARRGDVVLFHSLLLHSSGPNTASSPRIACIMTYMGAQARFVGRGSPVFPAARGAR